MNRGTLFFVAGTALGAVSMLLLLRLALPAAQEPAPTQRREVDLRPIEASVEKIQLRLEEIAGHSAAVSDRRPASREAEARAVADSVLERMDIRFRELETRLADLIGATSRIDPREIAALAERRATDRTAVAAFLAAPEDRQQEWLLTSVFRVLERLGRPDSIVTTANGYDKYLYYGEGDGKVELRIRNGLVIMVGAYVPD